MMPSNEIKKIQKSFNDLFKYKKLNLNWTYGVVNHQSAHLYGFHVNSWFTKSPDPIIINENAYNFTYNFHLKNLTNSEIKVFFDGQNYNYDLVNSLLYEFFNIGKSFNIYRDMTDVKNIPVENLLRKLKGRDPIYAFDYTKDVTKITLSSIFINKKQPDKPLKKMARYHLDFYLGEDSKIHPIMTLYMPYSDTNEFELKIDLHPATKNSQHNYIEKYKKDFKSALETKIDNTLKRRLKMKKDDLLKMTTEDKINYVQVLEMIRT